VGSWDAGWDPTGMEIRLGKMGRRWEEDGKKKKKKHIPFERVVEAYHVVKKKLWECFHVNLMFNSNCFFFSFFIKSFPLKPFPFLFKKEGKKEKKKNGKCQIS